MLRTSAPTLAAKLSKDGADGFNTIVSRFLPGSANPLSISEAKAALKDFADPDNHKFWADFQQKKPLTAAQREKAIQYLAMNDADAAALRAAPDKAFKENMLGRLTAATMIYNTWPSIPR